VTNENEGVTDEVVEVSEVISIEDLKDGCDKITVFGNQFLCEPIEPLPISPIVQEIEDGQRAGNEFHLVIRQVGTGPFNHALYPLCEDGRTADVEKGITLKVGDRIMVTGRMMPVILNFTQHWIVDGNSVKAKIESPHPTVVKPLKAKVC